MHGGRHGLQFLTVLEGKDGSGRNRRVHHVRKVDGSALGQRVGAVGSWRVAQDVVENGRTLGHDVLSGTRGNHVQHVALQRLGLDKGAVTLHGEGHRAQAVAHVRRLVGLQGEDALTQAVQLLRLLDGVQVVHRQRPHAVLHVGYATLQGHHIDAAQRVVVVQIALAHLQLDVVLALNAEHGVAQRIDGHERVLAVGGPVGLAHAIYQRHLHRLARQFAGGIGLVA